VMAATSLAGGAFGGALASRIPSSVLRWTVVAGSLVLAIVYLARP
jgi:uncharacterized membrane protein YfcA